MNLIPVRENARAQEMYAVLHAPFAKYKVAVEDAATRQFVKCKWPGRRLHQRSATEVVSYLMGWNDFYKVHSYKTFLYFILFYFSPLKASHFRHLFTTILTASDRSTS